VLEGANSSLGPRRKRHAKGNAGGPSTALAVVAVVASRPSASARALGQPKASGIIPVSFTEGIPMQNGGRDPLLSRRRFLGSSALAAGGALRPAASGGDGATTAEFTLAQSEDRGAAASLPLLPAMGDARWIWYPSGRTLANTFVLFRRDLDLQSAPRSATGWITADSRYLLEVNGHRIQWGPAPCDPRVLDLDPMDLASVLRAGRNTLGVTVLYYGHGEGTWPAGKPGFLFRLDVEADSGGTQIVVSDSSWRAHLSRAWRAGQYKRWYLRSLQEEFDARLHPWGWSEPTYKIDAAWVDAMVLDGPNDKPALCTRYGEYMTDVAPRPDSCSLQPRTIPPLRETWVPVTRLAESHSLRWLRPPEEYFAVLAPSAYEADREPCAQAIGPSRWRVDLDGDRGAVLTFELAEQVVGWPEFQIDAEAGTVVEILVHEAHTPGGPPLMNSHFHSWSRFIGSGGVRSFRTFDFESCRWIQLHVRGPRGRAVVSDVGVLRREFPWPEHPVVRCSEPALQRLFDASVNTLRNSAQETLVDGMARERQQYSGDCGHQTHAVYLAFAETRLPARFLATFSRGLTAEGYFLDCWPAWDRLARIAQRQLDLTGWGPILDHGVGFAFDCHYHYMYTGRPEDVAEPFPRLLRFADYLRGLRRSDGLLPVEGIGTPSVWIDHDAYLQQRHKQCAFNLYSAAMFEHALAPLCRAFGQSTRAEAAVALGRALLEATQHHFWSAESRSFVDNLPWLGAEGAPRLSDRALATAVLFDQCPGGDTARAARALVDCPAEMGFSYPANAGWRLWALARLRQPGAILQDLRGRWATMPSVILNNTLQESWTSPPDSSAQWSHCPVAPLYVLYMSLVGLKPLSPGFGGVELRPQLGDLGDLEVVAHTVRGPIRFASTGPPDARDVRVTLPGACPGELVVPVSERTGLDRVPCTADPVDLARYRLAPGRETRFTLRSA
jgi:alpha-L-rhamnosidase